MKKVILAAFLFGLFGSLRLCQGQDFSKVEMKVQKLRYRLYAGSAGEISPLQSAMTGSSWSMMSSCRGRKRLKQP